MRTKVFGYARVSSTEQNLDRQLAQLKELVADERDIYAEKVSGKNFNRDEYRRMIENLREGDLVVICSIDRLGRNYNEIREQWQRITKDIGADIKVLDMPLLDTSNSAQNLDKRFIADLVLQILSYTAEKERENIRKRQRQGIDVMKLDEATGKRVSAKTGRTTGRPNAQYPADWKEAYSAWKAGEQTATATIEQLQMTRTTFYKLVKQYEQ